RQTVLVLSAEHMNGTEAACVGYHRLAVPSAGSEGSELFAQRCDELAALAGRGDGGRAGNRSEASDQGAGPTGPTGGVRIPQIGDERVDRVGEDGFAEVGTVAAVPLVGGRGLLVGGAP